MRCPFCHLTIKDSAYKKLQSKQVFANVQEALIHEATRRPGIRNRFVKLCWMGMGDAINQPEMVHDVTLRLMEWIQAEGLAAGLDCVDLSTVLPPVKPRWATEFVALNAALNAYPQNPESFRVEQAEAATQASYQQRTPFRLFWSVHSAIQTTRDRMVPGGMPLAEAIPQLEAFSRSGPNLLLHQLFVEQLNDTEQEVDALIALLKAHFSSQELRVLRYNFCDRSPYREWDSVSAAVNRIASEHDRVKVQVSAGKEVAAACGQFLVAQPKRVIPLVRPIPVPSPEHAPVQLSGG
jgi:adenine C2-methylase RlmN of 23S rRNA A2503 and tRNA A37